MSAAVTWRHLCREPYRLFFPLGIGFGLLGAGHWLALGLGWSEHASGFFHATVQTGAFMPCFMIGFLLTALPRFASTTPSTAAELLLFLGFIIAQVLAAARGAWVAAEACQIGWLLALGVFAGRRFARKASGVGPPTEFAWIPAALLFGIAGNALLILGQTEALPAWALGVGRPLAQQGFLLAIVLGVGGFMAPRLMGRGFIASQRQRQQRIATHALAAAALAASFLMEGVGWMRGAYLLRALVVAGELAWTTQFYLRPMVKDLYVRLLCLSLWMMVLGYAAVAVWPAYRVALLHVVFLGGYSLMVVAVGTMVAFSHAGEPSALRQAQPLLWAVGAATALAALVRVAADFLPEQFFTLVAIAAAGWIAGALLWLWWLAPRFVTSAPVETLHREHEAAKARLLRAAAVMVVLWAQAAGAAADPRVKAGGEFRYRLELKDDLTLNDEAYEDDAVHLFRTRLHVEAAPAPWLRLFVQGQDAEAFTRSGLNRTASSVNQLDLRQLYAEWTSLWEAAPVRLKIGRQELSYGDQRFVGSFGWSNVSRVFDAVKLGYSHAENWMTDVWFAQVVPVDRVKPDSADHEENFYGWYTSMAQLPGHTVDTFLLVRHDLDNELAGERAGQRGQLKEYTLGNRVKGAWRALDYGIEWAWQFGSRAHNQIHAWAWHQELGYTWAACPWKPRLGMEYNHGSGDDDTNDGRFGTFNAPYPTNHTPYGEIDFTSLRNLDHLELNASASPHPRVKLTTKYHWFFLDSNKSAWFNSSQGTFRAATPNASRTLGQESDWLASWKATEHLALAAGYAYFHAGAFARDSGASDDAHFTYLQSTFSF